MSSHNSPISTSRKRPASSPTLQDDDNTKSPRQSTSSRRSRREDEVDELPWWEQDRKNNDVGSSSSSHQRDSRDSNNSRRDDRDRGSRGGGDDQDRRRYDNNDRSPPNSNSRNNNNNNDQRRGGGGGWQNDRRDSRNQGNGGRYNNNNNDNRSRNDYNNNNNNNNNNRSSYQGNNSRDSQREDVQLNYSDKPTIPTGPRSHQSPTNPSTKLPLESLPSSEPSEIIIEEEIDPEIIIAERRRKRAEILAKYSSGIANTESNVTSTAVSEAGTPGPNANDGRDDTPDVVMKTRDGTESPTVEDSNIPFSLLKDPSNSSSTHVKTEEEEPEMSAADYNPDQDRKEDDRRQAEREPGRRANAVQAPVITVLAPQKVEEEEDDEDDMFSTTIKTISIDEDKANGTFIPIISRASTSALLSDNFDDEEGYYKLLLGELLDSDRYHVHANLGKGMFSSVVRAKDLLGDEGTGRGKGDEVAIKVIRSQESMFKAGLKEAGILRKLQEADPLDKKHLIRLHRTFEHRGHLCLVFESLSMNLRDVVKRFGKDVGINLRAVRAYASQMFLALALLKKCDIMHADIKPDNILVNESKSVLKVCDLGSASDLSENDITPYLVSRFYRAPEIILGLPYDCALDTWSIGCTLYELYTGKILFPGRTNNHMLYLMMELKGKFNHKMIKKAKFGDQHFDESVNFILVEKSDTTRMVSIASKATHDLKSRLMSPSAIKKLKDDEIKLLGQFVDLLDKMLALEPAKRLTPKDMLNHPFLRG